MRMFASQRVVLCLYLVMLPIATFLALYGRYETPIGIIPGARPMVYAFSFNYLLISLYLAYRQRQFFVNYLNQVFAILILGFSITVLGLAIFRFHFSLGFLTIFFLTSASWTLFIENKRGKVTRAATYAAAKFGHWQLLKDTNLSMLYVDNPEQLEDEEYMALVIDYRESLGDDWLKAVSERALRNATIVDLADFLEFARGRVSLLGFKEEQMPRTDAINLYSMIKRVLDIVISALAIVVIFLPVCCLILWIRLNSPGPGLYKQERIGKNGKTFSLYKLRTMFDNAESMGPRFSTVGDPRVTRIGKVLRRYRIDEWPQFANVLRGEMSIVGPRPERSNWVESFKREIPYYDLRHLVRPGITGWAQIRLGYVADKEMTLKKLEYDLFYMKHMGPLFDFTIILKTMIFLTRPRKS
jgi:lipopolysaccharide/colanic/teichoic acid biosynthesis glycosyltransferase